MWLGGTLKNPATLKTLKRFSSSLNVMVGYLCVHAKLV